MNKDDNKALIDAYIDTIRAACDRASDILARTSDADKVQATANLLEVTNRGMLMLMDKNQHLSEGQWARLFGKRP